MDGVGDGGGEVCLILKYCYCFRVYFLIYLGGFAPALRYQKDTQESFSRSYFVDTSTPFGSVVFVSVRLYLYVNIIVYE